MKIALIGYGKMGKIIEKTALDRGHQIVLTIDVDNVNDFTRENLQKAEAAIEFTNPSVAFSNVIRCIEFDVPVVSGSTGWYDKIYKVKQLCTERGGSMLCASNFSLGVNVFFELNRRLAEMMNRFPEYSVEMTEMHHMQKTDAPSGTAITLAEGILDEIPRFKKWELNVEGKPDTLPIKAVREGNVPGTHCVKYLSDIDDIEIVHTAHNRMGFALGAVMAAEFIHDKKGIFTMKDLLKITD